MSKSKQTKFTTIFWNIWFKSQTDKDKLKALKAQFDTYIAKYDPEIFGLNEVLSDINSGKSAVLDYLEKKGYYYEYTKYSPIDDRYVTGTALLSKRKLKNVEHLDIGHDKVAHRRGHKDKSISIISADYPIDASKNISLIAVYMAHIVPYNWKTHLAHLKNFQSIIKQKKYAKNAIIGGDYNEFKFLINFWKDSKVFHRRTGNWLKPTWTWHGLSASPVRANYDNILWTKKGFLSLDKFKVLDRHPSDHAPILGEFTIRR